MVDNSNITMDMGLAVECLHSLVVMESVLDEQIERLEMELEWERRKFVYLQALNCESTHLKKIVMKIHKSQEMTKVLRRLLNDTFDEKLVLMEMVKSEQSQRSEVNPMSSWNLNKMDSFHPPTTPRDRLDHRQTVNKHNISSVKSLTSNKKKILHPHKAKRLSLKHKDRFVVKLKFRKNVRDRFSGSRKLRNKLHKPRRLNSKKLSTLCHSLLHDITLHHQRNGRGRNPTFNLDPLLSLATENFDRFESACLDTLIEGEDMELTDCILELDDVDHLWWQDMEADQPLPPCSNCQSSSFLLKDFLLHESRKCICD
ncbi:uncharacterized protein LOC131929439 isoform X2 [Physella acuta]|uniref:uncharacterized protein LOC131929439 isoform X2 n=1 Tax=Physella acuta TaxID=109671 RepID=UPI0027DB6F42|nr:uncharacterized protein LOC131929439 isoform X2 [Physella acuta]